jgi:hypothetical protein
VELVIMVMGLPIVGQTILSLPQQVTFNKVEVMRFSDIPNVIPQDRALVVNVNMLYKLVSHIIRGQKDYVIIRPEILDAKGR